MSATHRCASVGVRSCSEQCWEAALWTRQETRCVSVSTGHCPESKTEFTAKLLPAAHGGGRPLLHGARALPWLGHGRCGPERSQPSLRITSPCAKGPADSNGAVSVWEGSRTPPDAGCRPSRAGTQGVLGAGRILSYRVVILSSPGGVRARMHLAALKKLSQG